MTRRTARQNLRRLNVIIRYQRPTFRNFFLTRILLPPLHIENLFLWSHKFFGVPMTTETPFHLQRGGLISNRHLVDTAVAS